jgi:hypothetical protein
LRLSDHTQLTTADFQPAFLFVGALSAAAALVFMRLPADAGAELANRVPAPTQTETTDNLVG